MTRPDGGMFSIKLIHPNHLKYAYLTDDFDGADGRLPLMNFSGEGNGPAIAGNIPIGHRSLVYVIRYQKFIWAIEYIGGIEQGQQAAVAHGIQPNDITKKYSIFLPIRFLARVDLESAPTAAGIFNRTGIQFKANAFTIKYISAGEYQTIFDAINWDWHEKPSSKTDGLQPPQAVSFDLPPIPHE